MLGPWGAVQPTDSATRLARAAGRSRSRAPRAAAPRPWASWRPKTCRTAAPWPSWHPWRSNPQRIERLKQPACHLPTEHMENWPSIRVHPDSSGKERYRGALHAYSRQVALVSAVGFAGKRKGASVCNMATKARPQDGRTRATRSEKRTGSCLVGRVRHAPKQRAAGDRPVQATSVERSPLAESRVRPSFAGRSQLVARLLVEKRVIISTVVGVFTRQRTA